MGGMHPSLTDTLVGYSTEMVDTSTRELRDTKIFAISRDFKAVYNGEKLKHGIKRFIANKYKVSLWTVCDCWKHVYTASINRP